MKELIYFPIYEWYVHRWLSSLSNKFDFKITHPRYYADVIRLKKNWGFQTTRKEAEKIAEYFEKEESECEFLIELKKALKE